MKSGTVRLIFTITSISSSRQERETSRDSVSAQELMWQKLAQYLAGSEEPRVARVEVVSWGTGTRNSTAAGLQL